MSEQRKRRGLLGIGLDNRDGHKRHTSANGIIITGGSAETHERMTEQAIKTSEELKRRGKHLETVDPKELREILQKSQPK